MILICYDGSADARAAEGAALAGGLGMAATSKAASHATTTARAILAEADAASRARTLGDEDSR
jgi:hypothetical protein